jgi:hypothetical protein
MSVAEPVKQDNAAPPRRRLPNFVGFVLTIALVFLAGQFITQGISDNFLDSDPPAAVLWRGDSPDALTRFAEAQLPVRRYQLAERLAAKALRLEPLNATAISAYGLALDGAGDTARADQVMTFAGERSWRDPPAQIWLLRRRLIQGRYAEGFAHIDALLRQETKYPPLPFAIMAAAALDPRAVQPLADRLALQPRWRDEFLDFLVSTPRVDFVDVEGALLTRLAASAAPATDEELANYLDRLLNDHRYEQAVADWRRLSPPGSVSNALINDGDFERPARQSPFDWTLGGGVGWTAQIADAPGPSRGKGLSVSYDGVSPPQLVRQFLVLAPGAYRLSGMAYDQSGQGADQMSWKLICVGASDPIAQIPFPQGNQGEWRAFTADLTVPATDCPVQNLSLSADPGDVHKDIEVWYDNLSIVQIAASAGANAQSAGASRGGD